MACFVCSENAHAQIHLFCASVYHRKPFGKEQDVTRDLNLERSLVASVHAQLLNMLYT